MYFLPTLVLLCLVTVTACNSGDDSPGAGGPTPSTSSTTSVAEYTDLSDAPEHTELTPDAYALTAYGSVTAPLFVLDVPAGYERFGLLAVLSRQKAPNGDDAYGVAYWAPSGVYSDACTGRGSAPSPGSTAKDVATALFNQHGPRTTRPRPATIDGTKAGISNSPCPKHEPVEVRRLRPRLFHCGNRRGAAHQDCRCGRPPLRSRRQRRRNHHRHRLHTQSLTSTDRRD